MLRDRGIGEGDRVAMMVPNVPDFARVYYAVLALGAVVVPIHLLYKKEEIEHVLQDSGARLVVIAAPSLGEALPAAAGLGARRALGAAPRGDPRPRADPAPRGPRRARGATPIARHVSTNPLAPATILYTSGTTGEPKGAVGSHLSHRRAGERAR